jgi:hypothetical protein
MAALSSRLVNSGSNNKVRWRSDVLYPQKQDKHLPAVAPNAEAALGLD